MKYRVIGLVMLVAVGVFGVGGACEDVTNVTEGLCGDCGKIENGDATITGMAQLDGIFKALGTLDASTGSIKANFDANVRDMAAIFGIDVEGKATAELVAEIQAEFEAQITANAELTVDFVPPSCSADISVSASASAQCEAKAGCDVDVNAECDPGQLSFACEGKCTGGCSAGCEGSCTVEAEAALACEGTCKGSCDLSVEGGTCEGTCKGTCEGTCSAENGSGECVGECEGTCTGNCELPEAGGSCEGECKGSCTATVTADVECSGKCEGSCSGECTGGCEGSFDPPSCNAEASASCEASADCKAQAEAQASASLKCTPPSIAIKFEATGDASLDADIAGKLEMFKAKMIAVVQGMYELRALVEGNAELGIDPPVVTIGAAIEAFGSAVAAGEVEIEAPGLLPCAGPAFEEAADIIGNVAGDMSGTISAQLELFALIQG